MNFELARNRAYLLSIVDTIIELSTVVFGKNCWLKIRSEKYLSIIYYRFLTDTK